MRAFLAFAVAVVAAAPAGAAPTVGAAAAAAAPTVRIPLEPMPETSVGRIDGTRAFIAASLSGDRLRVYVCDGTPRRDPTISTWFRHRWDGRALTLHSDKHTLRIRPNLRGRFDGHAFRLRRATMPAGLFRGRHKRLRATWIMLANGKKRGTMVSTRKPCRFVLITGSNGQQQWVSVCS